MKKLGYKLFLIFCFLIIGLGNISAQSTRTIKGQIIDSEGYGIPGANIIEKGTTNGTQTDFDGNFSFTIKTNATLVISYVGYTTKDFTVGDSNNYLFILGDASTIYWCCTSHQGPKHCAETKAELEGDGKHSSDETYVPTYE